MSVVHTTAVVTRTLLDINNIHRISGLVVGVDDSIVKSHESLFLFYRFLISAVPI